MRVRVTLVRTIDVNPLIGNRDFCLDDIRDSITDHVMDEQDVTFESSDEKFAFTPEVVHQLTIEEEDPTQE